MTATTKGTLAKPVAGEVTVPYRAPEGTEGIALGFRMEMLQMGDGGRVNTGTGLGSDVIELVWGDRRAFVRGSELLKAWVATFAPEDAERFPV